MICKYYDNCEQACSTSMTCVKNGGGAYCGKYRVISAKFNSYDDIHIHTESPVRRQEILV